MVRRLVTRDAVDALHAATDALQAEASAFTRSRRERGVYFEVQSASGRKGDPAVAPGVLRKITSPSKRSKAFASLTTHANVRAVCAQLCGVSDGTAEEGSAAPSPGRRRSSSSSMRCVVDQVNLKHPLGAGTGFPWHQDVSFLKPDARAACEAHGGCNAVVDGPVARRERRVRRPRGTHRLGEKFTQTRDTRRRGGCFRGRLRPFQTFLPAFGTRGRDILHPALAHGSGTNHRRSGGG